MRITFSLLAHHVDIVNKHDVWIELGFDAPLSEKSTHPFGKLGIDGRRQVLVLIG